MHFSNFDTTSWYTRYKHQSISVMRMQDGGVDQVFDQSENKVYRSLFYIYKYISQRLYWSLLVKTVLNAMKAELIITGLKQ